MGIAGCNTWYPQLLGMATCNMDPTKEPNLLLYWICGWGFNAALRWTLQALLSVLGLWTIMYDPDILNAKAHHACLASRLIQAGGSLISCCRKPRQSVAATTKAKSSAAQQPAPTASTYVGRSCVAGCETVCHRLLPGVQQPSKRSVAR